MGREIRYVSPSWEHPKDERGRYIPMFDKTIDEAMDNWRDEYELERAYYDSDEECLAEFRPPTDHPQHYRPDWPAGSATAIRLYENISEGTPVSPAFQTEGELRSWMLVNGTKWSLHHPTEEMVDNLIRTGYAPTFIMTISTTAPSAQMWENPDTVTPLMPDLDGQKCMTPTRAGKPCQNTVGNGTKRCAAGHSVH